MQDYNWVSGRATAVAIDPADTSGNTVFLGGAGGGLWKATNAGSQSPNPASVVWQPLIDDQPTLAVGTITLQPVSVGHASNVILVGTGETNSSSDSYYGLGILRSSDGGSTWTLIQSALTGQSFAGIGFSKIAFSTANPNLAVAATAGDNGLYVGLEQDGNSAARGLYFSQDGGVTWNRCILSDGAVPSSATTVIYNPAQGATGTFYAFIQRHGLYSSTDGQNFTRISTQPTPGLALANCPAGSNAGTCMLYRGELAVVPGRNEMYSWIVDVQPDEFGNPVAADQGIWRSMNGGTSWTEIPDNGITNCGDSAFGPESGCGVEEGWYNLALAAIPNGSAATDVYAGAVNLYKCTLTGGTTCAQSDWLNLTHVYGCNPGPLGALAHVHPNQHGMAFALVGGTAPGYFAHDGGISRTLDGYAGLTTGSCAGTNQFDSLSQTLGSLTEFVSFSVDPTHADILLGGTRNNGSPKTGTATSGGSWQNALGGDGGFTAINPANPSEWFAENPYLTIVKCEDGPACDDSTFTQVAGSYSLGGDEGAFHTPFILDPQNASEMLVGTCRVWRVGTSGSAPLQLSDDFDTLGTGVCTGEETNLVKALAAGGPILNNNSAVVYAVTNGFGPLSGLPPGGEVWVTTNAGVALMSNVTQNVNPSGYAISAVVMDSSDPSGDSAYVGIMGFSTPANATSHVWQTTSAGQNWTDWSGVGMSALPDAPVNALLVDSSISPSQIYAGTDVGIFVSSARAPNWTEVGPISGTAGFLPESPVTALQLFNPNPGTKILLASTYGRGIWSYTLLSSPDFTNAISNPEQTIFPTQTATFAGTITALAGYATPVNLSCTGAPPSTCSSQPTSLTPTATYALTAGGVIGDYSFNVQAQGTDANEITHDASATLHVVDFNVTLPDPDSLTVAQGGTSAASTFQVTASGSFSGTVGLSCPVGLPAAVACVFSPSTPVSPTASSPVTVTLTVTAAASAPLGGPATVTIAAASAGAPSVKRQAFDLTVTAAASDFTWTDTGSPAASVLAGQTATYAFSVATIGGQPFASALSFTCAGNPSTTRCNFTPSSIAAGAPGMAQVALTIATSGPNSPTSSKADPNLARSSPRAAGIPFYAVSLTAFLGIMTLASRRYRDPRLSRLMIRSLIGVALLGLMHCGGVAGSGGGAPPPITVTVSPGSPPTLFPNNSGWPAQTAQFTATVSNTSNTAVTWTATSGGANVGSISPLGIDQAVYTAPSEGPGLPATVTITATSQADTTRSASQQEVIAVPTFGIFNIVVTATDTGSAHSDPIMLTVQ